MNIDRIINQEVNHKAFGVGRIISAKQGSKEGELYITVKFQKGDKTVDMVYPGAFEKFLTADENLQKEILQEMSNIRQQEEEFERQKKELMEKIALEKRLREVERIEKIYSRNDGRVAVKTSKSFHRPVPTRAYENRKELSTEQQEAMKILESGENVFLSGEAGTGKSYVINEFISRNKDKNIIVCAPTGIAAINVHGSTIHRIFHAPVSVIGPEEFDNKPSQSIIKADIIIIDEISMCRFDLFEYVVRTILKAQELRAQKEGQPEVHKQLIVVGDFFQLPPVIAKGKDVLDEKWGQNYYHEGFAFESPLWDKLNFRNIILTEVVRQQDDKEFLFNLNKIRRGDASAIEWFNKTAKADPIPGSIYLCGRNDTVKEVNDTEAEKLKGKSKIYTATVSGDVKDSDRATDEELTLKVGMQVMALVNDSEGRYQNGSLGVVTKLNNESVTVCFCNGRNVTVEKYDWMITDYEVHEDKLEQVIVGEFKQIPLKIAYAITIHKSQGQTYDSANIDPHCFSNGQLYVALSRVQNIENMSLTCAISRFSLRTSEEVRRFYETIQPCTEDCGIERSK